MSAQVDFGQRSLRSALHGQGSAGQVQGVQDSHLPIRC